MRGIEHQPVHQSMKRAHKIRKFRRGNAEGGRAYLGHKQKPWKQQRSAA